MSSSWCCDHYLKDQVINSNNKYLGLQRNSTAIEHPYCGITEVTFIIEIIK